MKNKFFNDFKKHLKEIDDAELGHEVKRMMTRLRSPGGNMSAHSILAAQMLVFCVHQVSGEKLEQVIRSMTIRNKKAGDFKITVKRISK